MGKISVTDDFRKFCQNLRMSDLTVSNIQQRYKSITKRINKEYWDSESETAHSLYVGSYGRGTATTVSDVDIVVELPWTIYGKYDDYVGNGQSALLQDVRNALRKTYSSSNIGADGQVVVIEFSDGVIFEIVPAFKFKDGRYYYPDTHDGGSWKAMNPCVEMSAMNTLNNKPNKNLKRLCRMARSWNKKMNVCMPGYLIDTTAYRFMSDYSYSDNSYEYYDWISRDYFKFLLDNADQSYWLAPGSNRHVSKKYSFKREAQDAYNLSLEAIDVYSKDYTYIWHSKWKDVFGTSFPDA